MNLQHGKRFTDLENKLTVAGGKDEGEWIVRKFGTDKSTLLFFFFLVEKYNKQKYGTLHEFACHPCAGAMLIFSVSFQF